MSESPTRMLFERMIESGGEFNAAWGRFFKSVYRLRRVVLLEFAKIGRAFRR